RALASSFHPLDAWSGSGERRRPALGIGLAEPAVTEPTLGIEPLSREVKGAVKVRWRLDHPASSLLAARIACVHPLPCVDKKERLGNPETICGTHASAPAGWPWTRRADDAGRAALGDIPLSRPACSACLAPALFRTQEQSLLSVCALGFRDIRGPARMRWLRGVSLGQEESHQENGATRTHTAPLRKRTREHIIASLSANTIERYFLKKGHTVLKTDQDYGVDLMVYTHDQYGYVEAGNIYIQ